MTELFPYEVNIAKKIMCSLIGYIGTKPNETVASTALLGCVRYFLYGGYYPKQGGKVFANSLQHIIESFGSSVITSTKVDEILVKNNSVVGVRCGDKEFISNIVVANANAKTVFLNLVPKGVLPSSFTQEISDLKMSKSETIVHFGLNIDLSSLSSIIQVFPKQEGDKIIGEKCDFFISSNVDPSTAPSGCSTLSIETSAKYSDIPQPGTQEYKLYKEKVIEIALKKLEKIIPHIREHIVVVDVITPHTLESFTSMPEGTLYSFDQTQGSKRPYFKTPVKGLYLASSSTFPGGGVEAVVASGLICTRDILSNKKACEPKKVDLPSPSLTSPVSSSLS